MNVLETPLPSNVGDSMAKIYFICWVQIFRLVEIQCVACNGSGLSAVCIKRATDNVVRMTFTAHQ